MDLNILTQTEQRIWNCLKRAKGAQTGPGAIKPKLEWIQSIVDQCRVAGVPVFLKDNLQDIWPGKLIQEYPEVA